MPKRLLYFLLKECKNMAKINQSGPGLTDGYTYLFNQGKSFWQKHGGQIMTVAGTAGLFATGVHACRKTYKIHKELEENGKRIAKAKAYINGEGTVKRISRVSKEVASCSVKTARHYVADAIAGGVCAYAIHKGWSKEHENYQQTAAMLGVVMADFMNYRRNNIAENGEEADRRFLTSKRNSKPALADDSKEDSVENPPVGDACTVQLHENDLRIWYSRETTPQVWSESLPIRIAHLEDITRSLNNRLIYGGSYTINDVRREFYGPRGDIGVGGMFGRVWDPGDKECPERGAFVNLHYEDDEDFMSGRTEGCWIIIDIDPEPLFESMARIRDKDLERDIL